MSTTRKIVAVNPAAPVQKKGKTMARRRNTRQTRRTRRAPRRRRAIKNPTLHPALMATLGTVAGAAVGGGADVALRYTKLSPYMRGGILAGTGIVAGLGLSFVNASLGAGVGGGLGSVGSAEIIMQASAPDPEDSAESSEELGRIRAELGRVRAQLSQGQSGYHALGAASDDTDLVYVDEEDLAYLG